MSTSTNRRFAVWISMLVLVSSVVLPLSAHAQVAQANDAGSGRDAGSDFNTAVPIQAGVTYTASLNNRQSVSADFSPPGDYDWFTFFAREGDPIYADVTSNTVVGSCAALVGPDGAVVTESDCSGVVRVRAPADGTYALNVGWFVSAEEPYAFVVSFDDPEPVPTPVDADMGTPSDPADVGPGQVVVAVADSGVNPYHEMYYRPQNTAHPCTWVEGFDDCSIPALRLSIGEYESFAKAFEADRKVWESLKLHQWYWIPRTNIVAAVCDGTTSPRGVATGSDSEVCILDNHSLGHGTGTTSSVLTEEPDALLVVHDGNGGAFDLPTTPVVPDIQSHSWGADVPLPLHLARLASEELADEFVTGEPMPFHAQTILFQAAGNIAPFPTVADSTKVDPDIQVVGGGYPGYWNPLSWTVYDFASWYCRPTATRDGVRSYAPSSCGTSFATPTAAGTAAAALLDIRRREGTTMRSTPRMVSETVSRARFIEALRAGASYNPAADRFSNPPEPYDQPLIDGSEHLSWGYGWLDRTRVDAIVACALDDICPSKSPDAVQYNATRQQIRTASTRRP